MFETTDHAEMPIPPAFRGCGERAWAYVFRRLHVVWFHVVYGEKDDHGGMLSQLLFLNDVAQLLDLAENAAGQILEVQVVLPRHITGARRWTMTPLKEIWVGREPSTPLQESYIYVLSNRKRHVDSALDTPEPRLLGRRLLFASPRSKQKRS